MLGYLRRPARSRMFPETPNPLTEDIDIDIDYRYRYIYIYPKPLKVYSLKKKGVLQSPGVGP